MTQASTGVGLLALVLAFTSVAETRAQDAPAPSPAPRLTPRLRPRPVAPHVPVLPARVMPPHAASSLATPADEVRLLERLSAPPSAAPQIPAFETALSPSTLHPWVLPIY